VLREQFVHERGAGHHRLAVDEHRAGAADLFEAVGVVGDGRGGRAGHVDGVERDLAEQRGDVHVRAIGDLELLDHGLRVGRGLALDLDLMVRVAVAVAIWICPQGLKPAPVSLFENIWRG
jgi:hypothetical protein